MSLKDLIGSRGEEVFAYLIGDWCFRRFWFKATFLGDKAEALDHIVTLINPSSFGAYFYVQVKATTRGYRGTGAQRTWAVVAAEVVARRRKAHLIEDAIIT